MFWFVLGTLTAGRAIALWSLSDEVIGSDSDRVIVLAKSIVAWI
jgi:hypothetical protein